MDFSVAVTAGYSSKGVMMKFSKELFSCGTIGAVSVLWGREATKVMFDTVNHDSGLKIFADSVGTLITRSIIGLHRSVHGIIGICSKPKITESIVSPILINVVNLVWRPYLMNVEPRKAVCQILALVNPNIYVATFKDRADDWFFAAAGGPPGKNACAWLIIERVYQVLVRKNLFFAHKACIARLHVLG